VSKSTDNFPNQESDVRGVQDWLHPRTALYQQRSESSEKVSGIVDIATMVLIFGSREGRST
jgi:hypothetical protein